MRIPQIFTLIHNDRTIRLNRPHNSRGTNILPDTNKKKAASVMQPLGDRDRIQTCNRLIRSQLLYSVELRGQ